MADYVKSTGTVLVQYNSQLFAPTVLTRRAVRGEAAPSHLWSSTDSPDDTYVQRNPKMNGQAMEMTEPAQSDPLLRLRQAIASDGPIIPTKSADATPTPDSGISLADATQLLFTEPTRLAFSLDTPTRFKSSDKPVDLRSIYFAWQKKDVAIPDYIASAQKLNEELSAQGAAGGNVHNLVFVERLDLITWLEGASEESEYIQPLASDSAEAAQAAGSTLSASEATGGIATISSGPAGRPGRSIDPRLAETYRLERRMGDRNTLLRGIRPTVGRQSQPLTWRSSS